MRIVGDFFRDQRQPPAEQPDVETQMASVSILDFFVRRQKIEEQGSEARVAQEFRHRLVARALPAAPAAMRKEDESARIFGDLKIAGKRHFACGDLQHNRFRRALHLLLERRRSDV